MNMKRHVDKHVDHRNIRVLQFLEAYERQQSLWNPTLESYKNKAARDEAYLHIIKDLDLPSLTIQDVKLKVKSIRTTYTKELRLLTKHRDEGRVYVPKLFWFHRADSFLKNVSLSRDKRSRPKDNIITKIDATRPCTINFIAELPSHNDREDMVDDVSHTDDDQGNSTSSCTYDYKPMKAADLGTTFKSTVHLDTGVDLNATSSKYTHMVPDEYQPAAGSGTVASSRCNDIPMMDASNISSNFVTTQSLPINSGKSDSDEYDVFCGSVAAQLRGISDSYSRAVAKLKIQQILFEAETGQYRNSTCVQIPLSENVSNI